jgi:hypothetical protein
MIAKIRRKKGMETRTALIGALIAGIVLAVVVFALVRYYPDADVIPGFNQTVEPAELREPFRLSILLGKIEYYDGTSWVYFEGKEIQLVNKTVRYIDMKSAFFDYYHRGERDVEKTLELSKEAYEASPLNPERPIDARLVVSLTKADVPPELEREWLRSETLAEGLTWIFSEERGHLLRGGDMTIVLVDREDSAERYGWFLISEDGIVQDFAEKIEDLSRTDTTNFIAIAGQEVVDEVREHFMRWKLSILEKPMRAVYKDLEGEDREIYVCANRFDEKYLVVDLADEVSSGAKC